MRDVTIPHFGPRVMSLDIGQVQTASHGLDGANLLSHRVDEVERSVREHDREHKTWHSSPCAPVGYDALGRKPMRSEHEAVFDVQQSKSPRARLRVQVKLSIESERLTLEFVQLRVLAIREVERFEAAHDATLCVSRETPVCATPKRPLFSNTISDDMSAGLTPLIRDACPRVSGRMRASFSRASIVMLSMLS